jgi:hypothetical protein
MTVFQIFTVLQSIQILKTNEKMNTGIVLEIVGLVFSLINFGKDPIQNKNIF